MINVTKSIGNRIYNTGYKKSAYLVYHKGITYPSIGRFSKLMNIFPQQVHEVYNNKIKNMIKNNQPIETKVEVNVKGIIFEVEEFKMEDNNVKDSVENNVKDSVSDDVKD